MSIPDFQTLMVPVLRIAADGEVRISDVVERLADEYTLSQEDRSHLLPSGKQTTFANRVHWAKSYLGKPGLYTFGYQFAPRYRDLHKKMDGLVGFHHPSHYAGYLIKPSRKTFDALIVKEWPNIQRILASLAQKDVTQATIVRKLSSYARQNQTKKALWELDNIRRTIHILNFIDDPVLRQSVQKALNRGEAYHRMRRAISYVNSGKFRVKTEAEQQIWNECSRLIANAIIYYNTLLLSRVYEQKLAADDQEAIKILRETSPVAWRDVNLIGNFDFSAGTSRVDIEALAARYNDPEFWRRSMREGDDGPAE